MPFKYQKSVYEMIIVIAHRSSNVTLKPTIQLLFSASDFNVLETVFEYLGQGEGKYSKYTKSLEITL